MIRVYEAQEKYRKTKNKAIWGIISSVILFIMWLIREGWLGEFVISLYESEILTYGGLGDLAGTYDTISTILFVISVAGIITAIVRFVQLPALEEEIRRAETNRAKERRAEKELRAKKTPAEAEIPVEKETTELICKQCGKKLPSKARFCAKCGTPQK